MCFASILFGQGYVVHTQEDILTEQTTEQTAMYGSDKQQSAEANSFVGDNKQQNLHAALLVFSLLGVEILTALDEYGTVGVQGRLDSCLCLSTGLCITSCCLLCLLLLQLQYEQRSFSTR